MAIRIAISDVAFANPIYARATMTVYTVDVNGAKTSTKATLYAGPTGSTLATNPQKLDSEGKLQDPVYVEVPVILTMSGISGVDDHDSGLIPILGNSRGEWATATTYFPGELVTAGADADDSGDILQCLVLHTSDDFTTDTNAGYWVVLLDLYAFAQKFSLLDPSGNALKFVRVNAAGTLYELVDAATVLSAIGAAAAAHVHGYLDPDVTDNLTVGYTTDIEDLGDTGTDTIIPDLSAESIKTATVTGGFTLDVPASGNGSCVIEFTNDGAGPHSPTISASYGTIFGTWDDTNAAVNFVQITKIGSNSYISISQPA